MDSPCASSITLNNEYGVFLFNNLQRKREFYRGFASNCIDTVIVECGMPTVLSLADLSASLVVPCSEYIQLLDILRGIPQDQNEAIGAIHLNTLVIENVSAFYWHVACLSSPEKFAWYRNINSSIHHLRQRYGCNVLVTGWDIEYDRGFNSRRIVKQPETLQDLSYLPSELFKGATRILHYDRQCLELRGWKWQQFGAHSGK